MKKNLIALACLLGLTATAVALTPKNKDPYGVQQYYSAKTSSVGTFYVPGYLQSWSARASGGTASFDIRHSTGMPITDFQINISSTINLASGDTINDVPAGIVYNATFSLTAIGANTTFYLDASELLPREPGN